MKRSNAKKYNLIKINNSNKNPVYGCPVLSPDGTKRCIVTGRIDKMKLHVASNEVH